MGENNETEEETIFNARTREVLHKGHLYKFVIVPIPIKSPRHAAAQINYFDNAENLGKLVKEIMANIEATERGN